MPDFTSAQQHLDWCKSRDGIDVKIVTSDLSALWAGADARVQLHDVRVWSKRRCPDDALYAASADLRAHAPRGLAFLEVQGPGEAAPSVSIVTHGLRKFSGGAGDDDDMADELDETAGTDKDVQANWMLHFVADPRSAKTLLVTTKANGESAHLSAFADPFPAADTQSGAAPLTPGLVWVAGSKNVHLVFRCPLDIDTELYAGQRFSFARIIANCAARVLTATAAKHTLPVASDEAMPKVAQAAVRDAALAAPNAATSQAALGLVRARAEDSNAAALGAWLSRNQLTMIMEMENPGTQHVEHFDFEQPRLRGITCMPCTSPAPEGLAQGLHPLLCALVMSSTGFEPVRSYSTPASELAAVHAAVRAGHGSEGAVLYYCDAAQHVIGLVKLKSVWYVVLRALREKCKPLGSRLDSIAQAAAVALTTDPGTPSPADAGPALLDLAVACREATSSLQRELKAVNKIVRRAPHDEPCATVWTYLVERGEQVLADFCSDVGTPEPAGPADAQAAQEWLTSASSAASEAFQAFHDALAGIGVALPAERSRRGAQRTSALQSKANASWASATEAQKLAVTTAAHVAAHQAVAAMGALTCARFARRLVDVQAWLGIGTELLAQWAALGHAFIWETARRAGRAMDASPSAVLLHVPATPDFGEDGVSIDQVLTQHWSARLLGVQFPVCWQAFLRVSHTTDVMPLT